MYTANDGKAFGNHEQGKHYDSSRSEPKGPKVKPEPEGEHQEENMQDVVSEHGPAEHVEIHSHHEDGHVHKSKHHDAHSARNHVSMAFGEQPEEHAEPDGDEHAAMQAPSIPTMA